MKNFKKLLLLSSTALLFGAVTPWNNIFAEETEESTEQVSEAEETNQEEEFAFEVVAEVMNQDEEVLGTATFREDMEGLVTLHLELEGLEAGEFGMHIHEVGLATAPDFEDAGGHYNPTDVEHGHESETGPHLGDLPNLVVGEDGKVDELIEIPEVSLDPEAEYTLNSTDGTALIIHSGTDDYKTQPTGDAGGRQAAAVIFAPLEDSEFYQAESDSTEEDTSGEETEEETEE